jgi:predicted acetyltransferase
MSQPVVAIEPALPRRALEGQLTYEVRACSSVAEVRQALRPIWHYVGRSAPNEEQSDRVARVIPPERVLAAWDGEHVVGGAASFGFALTIPGGRVPAAGVTAVGVLPTHRRRGILRAMMRAQLDECHERGESVAYLWATEDAIYGHYGYGIASVSGEIDIPREHSAYAAPIGWRARAQLVPLEDAEELVAPIWERVALMNPGMFSRTSAWWRARTLSDYDGKRRGFPELQCMVVDIGSGPAAYGLYRLHFGSDRGMPTGTVDVIEAMGDSAQAMAAIWRCLLDIDWMARVKARCLPLDHPLFLLLAEPRWLRFNLRDGLWVRLVDVKAALSARAYAGTGTVVVEIADTHCPWNAGRWRLGEGPAEKTGAPPELRCDVTALASVYLGGFTWAELARGLRVDELCTGAVGRADGLFRATAAPWCPEIF